MSNVWLSLLLIPAAVFSIFGYYTVIKRRPSLLANQWLMTTLFVLPPAVIFIVTFVTPPKSRRFHCKIWRSFCHSRSLTCRVSTLFTGSGSGFDSINHDRLDQRLIWTISGCH